MTAFSDDVIAAIARHMNDDHAAESVVICRVLGGQPAATAATMTGMDADGIEFDATVDDAVVPVRIPFGHRLTERAEVRVEVTRLYHEAQAVLDADGTGPAQ